MSIKNAITATRVIESLESYSKSDLVDNTKLINTNENQNEHDINDENQFWENIFNDTEGSWNEKFTLREMTVSEHIGRVPGLYYHPSSYIFKQSLNNHIEFRNGKWVHYTPNGKSQKILSGLGTLQIPPNIEDWRIASISSSCNASQGIPILIHEEVWEHFSLGEGKKIKSLTAKWRQMDRSWAKRFPSVRGIPKGYLVVKNPDQLDVYNEITPTIYHPFTIMEYVKDGGVFYDFVYVTVHSYEQNYREKIRAFLVDYKNFNNRSGRYLIEPFVNNPLISDQDVLYQSPQELRKENDSANSQLNLLVERIKKEIFNDHTIDEIKVFIDQNLSLDDLKMCSDEILINPNLWLSGNKVADQSANLIDKCREEDKIEELVDILLFEGL